MKDKLTKLMENLQNVKDSFNLLVVKKSNAKRELAELLSKLKTYDIEFDIDDEHLSEKIKTKAEELETELENTIESASSLINSVEEQLEAINNNK